VVGKTGEIIRLSGGCAQLATFKLLERFCIPLAISLAESNPLAYTLVYVNCC
jgi:hypothetical protein